MALTDIATGREVKSLAVETEALEGPELEAARKQIQDDGDAALERLSDLDLRNGTAVTVKLLLDALQVERSSMIDFCITHVRRRAVLREDAADATAKTLTPVWRGVWRDGSAHAKDSLVAHANALWIATASTAQKPGTPGGAWRLCVKSPR